MVRCEEGLRLLDSNRCAACCDVRGTLTLLGSSQTTREKCSCTSRSSSPIRTARCQKVSSLILILGLRCWTESQGLALALTLGQNVEFRIKIETAADGKPQRKAFEVSGAPLCCVCQLESVVSVAVAAGPGGTPINTPGNFVLDLLLSVVLSFSRSRSRSRHASRDGRHGIPRSASSLCPAESSTLTPLLVRSVTHGRAVWVCLAVRGCWLRCRSGLVSSSSSSSKSISSGSRRILCGISVRAAFLS